MLAICICSICTVRHNLSSEMMMHEKHIMRISYYSNLRWWVTTSNKKGPFIFFIFNSLFAVIGVNIYFKCRFECI